MNPAYLPSNLKSVRESLRRRIIAAARVNPEFTHTQLAERFGVHHKTVRNALRVK